MTTESLAGEALVAEILAACDRLLGEIGRRQHMFGWLRLPGGEADQWLAVDAYYPGNRVVVACSGDHDSLLAELVPSHGLRLLRALPDDLAREPDGVSASLERMIAGLAPAVRPSGAVPASPVARESAVVRALTSMTQPVQRPRVDRRRPRVTEPERTERFVAAGLLVGIALVAVLCCEIYVGLEEVALGAGHVVLAFGIALDACSRVLGTVAAHRAEEPRWVWPCVIGGSPVVVMFALFQRSGPVTAEPAPLAGLLSVLALGTIAIALAATVLGI